MVHVKNLAERISLKAQAVLNELALEIAHPRHPMFHTTSQRVDGLGGEAIDAARNVSVGRIVSVVKTGYGELVIGRDVKGLFIIRAF